MLPEHPSLRIVSKDEDRALVQTQRAQSLQAAVDQPPANACQDASTLKIFEAVGECGAATGVCTYGFELRTCTSGCANDQCQNQDLCQGVTCDSPPADSCLDADTKLTYQSPGTCEAATGRCQYTSSQEECPQGCVQGKCQQGPQAEGFITVFENHSEWGDSSEVKAYFAETLHMRKTPPFIYDPEHMVETARKDACILLGSRAGTKDRLDMCDPPCGPDQYCGGMTCADYPTHYNVGTITMTGLRTALELTPDAYDNYQYYGTGGLTDLFDSGAEITAQAAGGELGPLAMSAKGVAPLVMASTVVTLVDGQPITFSWTPTDPGSRVQVFLRAGNHRPSMPDVAIVCDVLDDDGKVIIPASLVDGFKSSAYLAMQPCEIMRYTNQLQSLFGGQVELRVASVVNLTLSLD